MIELQRETDGSVLRHYLCISGATNFLDLSLIDALDAYFIPNRLGKHLGKKDGPAIIFYHRNNILIESYFNTGINVLGKDRTDGPAYIRYGINKAPK